VLLRATRIAAYGVKIDEKGVDIFVEHRSKPQEKSVCEACLLQAGLCKSAPPCSFVNRPTRGLIFQAKSRIMRSVLAAQLWASASGSAIFPDAARYFALLGKVGEAERLVF